MIRTMDSDFRMVGCMFQDDQIQNGYNEQKREGKLGRMGQVDLLEPV